MSGCENIYIISSAIDDYLSFLCSAEWLWVPKHEHFFSNALFFNQYMIHRLIGQQYEYGRCYNYTTVANMCARICGRYAYYKEGQDDSIELNGRLIDFESEKWIQVMNQFVKLRGSLIRKDASITVLPTEIEGILGADEEDEDLIPDENDEIDNAVESSDAFSESFEQMRSWLKFHACMSNIQPQFDNALQGGTDVIPLKSIVAFE